LSLRPEHLLLLPGLVALAFAALTVAVGRRELAALVKIAHKPLERALTVCIPARNEAARIRPTLEALLRDEHPDLRVVVLDDASDDETARIVRELATKDPRLSLAEVTGEPEGFGKPRALHAALAAATDAGARTSPILFLDADVTLEEGSLGGLVDAFERSDAHALSGVPRLICKGPLEGALVPAFVSVLGARFRPSKVHDDDGPVAMLNGQLILVDPDALEEVGGWPSVSGAVLEDVALAGKLKAKGKRLRLADLRFTASTRMYESLGQIARGFGKNVVPAVGGPLKTALVGVLGLFIACLAPASAILCARSDAQVVAIAGSVAWLLVMRIQMTARRDLAVPGWVVVFHPLTYLIVMFVLVKSAAAVALGGKVRWKGRSYRASRD
jgi:cellulose synthase/poly-beta-1,6-N-acetylglucosamine synthase-like glycosyltransferase